MKTLFTSLTLALITLVPTASAQTATLDAGEGGNKAISVESNLLGAPFALEGPAHKVIVRGTVPARVINLATSPVSIHYGDIPGCITPKPQHRETGTAVRFFGRYECPAVTPPAPLSAGVKITPHQAEVLPGGIAKFTVAVHNFSSQALNGAVATVEFNPAQLSLKELPQGGRLAATDAASWPVPSLQVGETWTVVFQGQVAAGLSDSTRINVISRVTGGNIASTAAVVASASVGVPVMPPTGVPLAPLVALSLFGLAGGTVMVTRRLQ